MLESRGTQWGREYLLQYIQAVGIPVGGDLGYDRIGQTYNDFELYIYMIINFECWMMDLNI